MNIKVLLKSILILSFSFTFTSCGSVKDMKKNAEEASKNSGDAAKAAQESREEIANSRMMSRIAAASKSRREALNAMMSAKTFEKKAVESAKYFKSFEFQVWTGQKYDTQEYLEALYSSSIKEFFRDLVEAYDGKMLSVKTPSPFKLLDRTRHLNALAMASTLHSTSEVQDLVTVKRLEGVESSTSMYDLIKSGLIKHVAVKNGSMNIRDLKDYEHDVSVYAKEAIALLQARANMMLTLTLVKVSPVGEKKSKAITLQLPTSKKFNSGFSSLSPARQDKVLNGYLKAALGVKTFLNSIGVELEIRKDILKIYSKMVLPSAALSLTNEDLLFEEALNEIFQ